MPSRRPALSSLYDVTRTSSTPSSSLCGVRRRAWPVQCSLVRAASIVRAVRAPPAPCAQSWPNGLTSLLDTDVFRWRTLYRLKPRELAAVEHVRWHFRRAPDEMAAFLLARVVEDPGARGDPERRAPRRLAAAPQLVVEKRCARHAPGRGPAVLAAAPRIRSTTQSPPRKRLPAKGQPDRSVPAAGDDLPSCIGELQPRSRTLHTSIPSVELAPAAACASLAAVGRCDALCSQLQ